MKNMNSYYNEINTSTSEAIVNYRFYISIQNPAPEFEYTAICFACDFCNVNKQNI